MPGWIHVPVRIETHNKLDTIKREGQSYDSLINELLKSPKVIDGKIEQAKKEAC